MPRAEVTRLTIVWSKDTDMALRSHLGARGLKKDALSRFIEDAVKWRILEETVNEVRAAFADIPPHELQNLIKDAVASARKERRRIGRYRTRS